MQENWLCLKCNVVTIASDNNTVLVDDTIEIAVKKSAKSIRLVKLGAHSYFSVLRKRLNWGVDSRN